MRHEELDIDSLELRGFSRSFAELEWLLLILMLFYTINVGSVTEHQLAVSMTMVMFAGFVIAFRYTNLSKIETRWKLAVEVQAMLISISSMLWFTGALDSPLLNLYLLVIIASALTLGKLMTMLQLLLIVSCYVYMMHSMMGSQLFSVAVISTLMTNFAPFLLVAYLTTMLSTDLRLAKKMVLRRSETDELTGAMNSRGFNRSLAQTVSKADRYARPFSLIVIDADNLKQVNDSFGHVAGDRLIREIVDTIQPLLRESDTLARYGGDEFVVILPETGSVRAKAVAERIREAIADSTCAVNMPAYETTVSIGIATFPEHTSVPSKVFERADEALYQSKSDGRNKITLFSELSDSADPEIFGAPANLFKLSA